MAVAVAVAAAVAVIVAVTVAGAVAGAVAVWLGGQVAQNCWIFDNFGLYFWCFGGSRESNFGNFQALETPIGDLGLQGSILGPSTSRNTTFGRYCLGYFLHVWGIFFRCNVDVKTVGKKVVPKRQMDAILEPKME